MGRLGKLKQRFSAWGKRERFKFYVRPFNFKNQVVQIAKTEEIHLNGKVCVDLDNEVKVMDNNGSLYACCPRDVIQALSVDRKVLVRALLLDNNEEAILIMKPKGEAT